MNMIWGHSWDHHVIEHKDYFSLFNYRMAIYLGCLQSPLTSCVLHHTSTRSPVSITEALGRAIKSLTRALTLLRGSRENRQRSDDEPSCLFKQKAREYKTLRSRHDKIGEKDLLQFRNKPKSCVIFLKLLPFLTLLKACKFMNVFFEEV